MSDELVFDHYPMRDTELPDGWVMCGIGSVSESIASGFPSGAHNSEGRGVPHIRPMNIDREGRFDLSTVKSVDGDIPKLLAKGDVLFNNTNSPELIGKTAVIPIDDTLAYSNHMTRIRVEKGMNPSFVAKQLHFLWMSGYFRHRCKNHVNQASIAAEPLSRTVPLLVAPATQQDRIAEILDELLSDLDAGVAALERVRAKLGQYRAAVLKAAVQGELTADWRETHPATEPASELLERILVERRRRWEEAQLQKFKDAGKAPPRDWKAKYPEPAATNTANLPSLPAGWCWATPQQLGNVQLGRQRAPQHHRGDHMRQYLRVANVYEGRIDLGSVYEMNFTPEEYNTFRLENGDILLNEGQSLELVGRSAIYRDELPGACFTNTLVRFRPHHSVLPEYAQVYFMACLRSHRFRRIARWTTNIAHLGADRFAVMEFPLPPLGEQKAIVELVEDDLSIIDHLEANLNAKLQSSSGLRQSILRHAFAGQLVPQEASDEPASELLKRIAAEREERERQAQAEKNGKPKTKTPRKRKTKPKTVKSRK